MDLKFLHFYPDLMSLYGSWANAAVLRRHLEDLGCTVTVETVRPGEAADLAAADFVYMGAGTERSQKAALADFCRFAPDLKASAQGGTTMFFAGTAWELLGKSVTGEDGTVYDALGLAEFTSVQSGKRIVGDVYGKTDLYEGAVVGFMNKCSRISGVDTPLLAAAALGFGNEAEGGSEGFHWNHVFGSHLTGPILVKNPRLLDAVVDAIYACRGQALPANRPAYPWEEEGYAVTAEQLRLRSEQR